MYKNILLTFLPTHIIFILNVGAHYSEDLVKQKFNSDIGRIKQILMNLISNSLKFTNIGGIFVKISQNKLKNNRRVDRVLKFVVSDTGIGISKEDSCNLFKMFSIVSKNQTFNSRGTGLGLTISK